MRQKGYTLLEMVVVMSIIGLVTAITVPKLSLLYERFEFSLEKDDLLSQIKVLSYKAYSRGDGFTLETAFNDPELLQMSEEWTLISGKEIYYSAIGICSGGVSEISRGELFLQFNMSPPFCEPKSARATNQ